ncbi:MAG: diguanylate cyclase [Proteobacteria bacterium]|nr:diguanylate cyclase [Pseudomonadota bacterium]MBU1389977.1 diguanylate cyclase [Pseudomonadota bacterium]MBU1545072.1 diguanylate cyclase [Pseudomonadota bacterium]MBU2480883.1 diguanylate cyclase [Pseudomonadota bacterium]
MKTFQDYTVLEQIAQTRGAMVYRGIKQGESSPVIIKVLKVTAPSVSNIARVKKEYDIICSICHDGIVRVIDMVEHKGQIAVITENIIEPSLETCLEKQHFDLVSFLEIGINLCKALAEIHQKDIFHGEIKPSHLYLDEAFQKVRISDFGIVSILTRKNEEIYQEAVIRRGLFYVSPEQTGRMNRWVDYRTDMYSLGIVFYEMLTGTVPFEFDDPMEVIYSHIAVPPIPPHELDSDIPQIISLIILKLLNKNAEERYQNAMGIAADLAMCLKQIKEKKPGSGLAKFKLGKKDIPRRFIIPQKLYGRKNQIQELMSCFEKACDGESQVMMVSGMPGIGKSALVKEIAKPVVAKRGFFITGKYEQYRKDVPYSAIIQAFQTLIRQILSQSDETILQFKEKLLSALGPNGRVISSVIHDIDLIIGQQPEVPNLGPEETRNRFNLVFERFVSVFSQKQTPLVLFLDDLQWADYASLEMIKNIAVSDEIAHLMIIGSYRKDELIKDHPLELALKQIKNLKKDLNTLDVGPLEPDHVFALVHDHLKGSAAKCKALGDLVYKKTGGNPFFVNQFLKTLYDEGMIQLDSKAVWQWDARKISDLQVTDNLVDLLVNKINKLKKKTRETLKICACIGNRFDLEVIAALQKRPVGDILEDLKEAIQEGLIDGTDKLYFYQHDRIQEAAYSLLLDDEKSRIHYRIGQKIIGDMKGKPLNGKLFYVADQLNAGVQWVSNSQEKEQLVLYNFKAGAKAKASAAYATALKYYQTGLELLGENCWEKQYKITLEAYSQVVEIYYLLDQMDNMQKTVDLVIEHAHSPLDQAAVTTTLIKALTSRQVFDRALEKGVHILGLLGISIPEHVDDGLIFEILQDVMANLAGKTDDDLLNLPDMTDENMLASARVIFEMATAAYTLNRPLSSFIWMRMLQIHLQHGLHPVAASAFVSYGVILLVGLGDLASGKRFGELAFKILEKYNDKSLLPSILNTYNLMIRHWFEPAEKSAQAGLEIFQLAMESGSPQFAALGLFLNNTYSLAGGMPLPQLEKIMIDHARVIKKLNQHHVAGYHSLWLQMVMNLMGKNKNPLKLTNEEFDEQKAEQLYLKNKDYISLCNFYQTKFILFLFFEEYGQAFEYLKKAEQYQDHIRGLINSCHMVFLGAVIRLAIYDTAGKEEQKELMAAADVRLLQLQHWLTFSPVNFSHRCKLVEAMKAQSNGDMLAAMDRYDEAINLCHENGYDYEISFATTVAGSFFKSRGKERIAHLYLHETYKNHQKSGNKALVQYFRSKYPFLREADREQDGYSDTKNDHGSLMLDVQSVLRASQAISGEILLGSLLTKMMEIALKHAGAQKGFIILSDNDAFFVEAESNVQDNEIKVQQSIPIEKHKGFSQSLIQLVARTQKTIILENACQEGDFTQDAYFKAHKSKSVLCQPIMNQGRLVGVLYLENNIATGVFTQNHLEVLRIIGPQAAISIENANLYANLEKKVKERTRELENAYEKIKRLANTDPLTQLSNRRDMLEKIASEKVRMGRNKSCAALILGDIDNFKSINDTYGHDCGDFVLKSISQTMKQMIRKQDVIARWGGEEFLLLLPKTDLKGAGVIAQKIRKAICRKEYMYNEQSLPVSMTFGVSYFDNPGIDIDISIKEADDALYRGKETGKNRVVLSDGVAF